MLAQMLVSAVSLVDIAMVGRLGPHAVAAVGYASQFFNLAQAVLFAIGTACVALMARSIGAGDRPRARVALAASLIVALGTSLLFLAIILAAPRWYLRGLGAEPDVIDAAIPYLVLVLLATVFLAVSITLESALRADRNTRRADVDRRRRDGGEDRPERAADLRRAGRASARARGRRPRDDRRPGPRPRDLREHPGHLEARLAARARARRFPRRARRVCAKWCGSRCPAWASGSR